MNFDNYSDEIRKSPILEDKFKLKVNQGSLADNDYISFINARKIMQPLADATKNVGVINVTRDEDGIIRNTTPVFKYKGDYYPNLSLAVALDKLKSNAVIFQNGKIELDKEHSIPLDKTNRAILNWYGKSKTHNNVSFWEVLKAQKNNDIQFLKNNFENKIIYIGTTATSLYDLKSTPVDMAMSGVELHATFINNILDNNFIKKIAVEIDFLISIILSLLVGYYVLKTHSVVKTFFTLFFVIFLYCVCATFIMHKFNLWISVVLPVISIIMTFVLVYCEKYLLK